jgi:hypothetical protein
MKKVRVLLAVVVLIAGCDRSDPITSPSAEGIDLVSSTIDVPYSEQSMLNGVLITNLRVDGSVADSGCYDSLKHRGMLDSLKEYVLLTDAQVESVNVFAATLKATLDTIRSQAQAGLISRDSARALVKAARDLFIASVRSVLTNDQETLLDAWILKFWERPIGGPGGPRHGGRGGRGGGHGGPGGPGGGGPGPHGP